MKGKKANMSLAVLSALAVFVCGFLFINFLTPEIDTFRTAMDCSNVAGITDGQKIMCLGGGLVVPYFIIGLLSLAIGGITSRLTLR